MRVAGGKDQTMLYNEERGWYQSKQRADEVDHIIPESQTVFEGRNPDETVGIPRSRQHHTGTGLDENGEIAPYGHPAWSRHPDMGEARESYRKGDKKAFSKAANKHIEAVMRGTQYTNYDHWTQEIETAKMEQLAKEYVERNPKDPKPTVKHRVQPVKTHWWDIVSGKRGYTEDEG